jgi:lysophospholipase L1-like esterase
MSVPTNSLTIKEWFVFAEHLATNHTLIGHSATERHYVRSEFVDLQGAAFSDLHSPALIAEAPDSEGLDAASNNLLARRYLAWTVVKQLDGSDNPNARLDAELECETLAQHVLARLRAERIHRGGNVFADVLMDQWEGSVMTPFLKAGWAGYRIMVPVLVNDQRLKHDPANWQDQPGAPLLLRDVSGLSCPNLNHPTLGLTQEQRLQCVLPQYDFSEDDTFNALTDQQEDDLAERLGGTGPAEPTTVNGTESDTPTITVLQGGVQVGTLNPATGVHTVPECEPAEDVTIRTTDGLTTIDTAAPGTNYDLPRSHIKYQSGLNTLALDDVPTQYEEDDVHIYPDIIIPERFVLNSESNPASSFPVRLVDLRDNTVPSAADGAVSIAGVPVGTVPSNGAKDFDCADLVDAVVVEGAGIAVADGLYVPNLSRIENGRPVYEHSADMGAGDDRRFRVTSGNWWALFSDNATPEASFNYSAPSDSPEPAHPYDVAQLSWAEDTAPMLPVPTIRQATIADLCPCAVPDDATVNVNGELYDTPASGATLNIPVVNTDADPVGTVDPGVNVVIGDAQVQLQDTDDNPIGLPVDIAAESTGNTITAPDGSVQRRDSAGNAIGSAIPVRSNQTGLDVTCPDGSVQLRDSAANNIGSPTAVRSNASVNVTAPDASAQLKDSAGNNIGSPTAIRSNASANITAPDGTINAKDRDGNTLATGTVRSGATADLTIPDAWDGEFPAITENTPSYNDEGTSTAGWTNTSMTPSTSGGVLRFTMTTTGVAATSTRSISQPVSGKDWVMYGRARAGFTSAGTQVLAIKGTGTEAIQIYFNFNTVTNSQTTGTLSMRSTNAAGTNANVVLGTGLSLSMNWVEFALLFDHKNQSFAFFNRQTDGSWAFVAHINGTSFMSILEVRCGSAAGTSYLEWDYLTIVAPNFQSIGDSLTRGSTLFSPIVADALTDGTSQWQRWAPVYTSLRNNLIVNKGVGGNTTTQVNARIQADVIDCQPKLVFLSACNNDFNSPQVPLATRTSNTQSSINLCATAGIPVILYNATYSTADDINQPAQREYYEDWWKNYKPTLTGVQGSIDIMDALRNPQGYADNGITQSDGTHPTPIGYRRMGQWIAALPYA